MIGTVVYALVQRDCEDWAPFEQLPLMLLSFWLSLVVSLEDAAREESFSKVRPATFSLVQMLFDVFVVSGRCNTTGVLR